MASLLQQQYGATQKENLHQQVLLPLLSGISCGGFLIYASPVIYTQELDQARDFYEGLARAQVLAQSSSQVALRNPTNQSFSYLHENIQPEFVKNSLFNFMPILKNIDTRNIVPVIDFEEYNKLSENQRTGVQLHYILMNLYDILPKMSDEVFSSVMMRIPLYVNNPISFLPYPKKGDLDFKELRKMLISQSEQDLI